MKEIKKEKKMQGVQAVLWGGCSKKGKKIWLWLGDRFGSWVGSREPNRFKWYI